MDKITSIEEYDKFQARRKLSLCVVHSIQHSEAVFPPKRRYIATRRHGVQYYRSAIYTVTAVCHIFLEFIKNSARWVTRKSW